MINPSGYWHDVPVALDLDPRVQALCERIRNPDAAIYLVRLWRVVKMSAPDGFLNVPDAPLALERLVGFRGKRGQLVEALALNGFIRRANAGIMVIPWREVIRAEWLGAPSPDEEYHGEADGDIHQPSTVVARRDRDRAKKQRKRAARKGTVPPDDGVLSPLIDQPVPPPCPPLSPSVDGSVPPVVPPVVPLCPPASSPLNGGVGGDTYTQNYTETETQTHKSTSASAHYRKRETTAPSGRRFPMAIGVGLVWDAYREAYGEIMGGIGTDLDPGRQTLIQTAIDREGGDAERVRQGVLGWQWDDWRMGRLPGDKQVKLSLTGLLEKPDVVQSGIGLYAASVGQPIAPARKAVVAKTDAPSGPPQPVYWKPEPRQETTEAERKKILANRPKMSWDRPEVPEVPRG